MKNKSKSNLNPILSRTISTQQVQQVYEWARSLIKPGDVVPLSKLGAEITFKGVDIYNGKAKSAAGKRRLIFLKKNGRVVPIFVDILALVHAKWITGEELNTTKLDNYRSFIHRNIGEIPNLTRDEGEIIGLFRELLRRSARQFA